MVLAVDRGELLLHNAQEHQEAEARYEYARIVAADVDGWAVRTVEQLCARLGVGRIVAEPTPAGVRVTLHRGAEVLTATVPTPDAHQVVERMPAARVQIVEPTRGADHGCD